MKFKIILIPIVLILCLFSVFAIDTGHVNETILLASNHPLAQSGYFTDVTAYITIAFPNGTSDILNQPTTESLTEPGVFYYNYTPVVSGVYFTSTQFYNGSSDIGVGSSTFYISEPPVVDNEAMSGITTLIALGLVAGLLLILAFKMDKEYAWMRNILVVFSFLMIVGIAATALLHKDSCGLITVNGALVKQCVSTTTTTSVEWWLFVISISILSLVVAAIIVGLFIKALKSFVDSGQKLQ